MDEHDRSKGRASDADEQQAADGAGTLPPWAERNGGEGTLVDYGPSDFGPDTDATRITPMPSLGSSEDESEHGGTRVTAVPAFLQDETEVSSAGGESPDPAQGAEIPPAAVSPACDGAAPVEQQAEGVGVSTRRNTVEDVPGDRGPQDGEMGPADPAAADSQGAIEPEGAVMPAAPGIDASASETPWTAPPAPLDAVPTVGQTRVDPPLGATLVDFSLAPGFASLGGAVGGPETVRPDAPAPQGDPESSADAPEAPRGDDIEARGLADVSTPPQWSSDGDADGGGLGQGCPTSGQDGASEQGEWQAAPEGDDQAPVAAHLALGSPDRHDTVEARGDGAEAEPGAVQPPAPAEPAPPAHLAAAASDEPHAPDPDGMSSSPGSGLPDSGDPESTAAGSEEPSTSESSSIGESLPSTLRLPSIDFSMPSFSVDSAQPQADDTAVSSPGPAPDPAGANGGSDLPAHLQLPSFPDFDVPSVTGSQAEPQSAPATQTEPAPSAPSEYPADGDATPTMVQERPPAAPPAMPPTPPRAPPRATPRATRSAPAPSAPAPLPSLPAFGDLPEVSPVEQPRDPTLLSSDAAEALAATMHRRSPVGLFLLFILIVGAGAGAYLYRDRILKLVVPPEPRAATPTHTPRQRAVRLLAAGARAYDAKKYNQAIAQFKKAIAADHSFGLPHRGLGIVFATMEQHDKAVEHYRRYVVLEPDGDDVSDVKKIISDYEKVQKKSAPEETNKAGRRRKRRGR